MGTAANVQPLPDQQPPTDPYKKRIEANKVYAVLYVHDGEAVQVLLIEDGHKVNAGKVDLLGFPGGQIDDDYRTVRGLHGRARNELDLIHAIRETKEETGLDLRYEDVTFLHRVRVDGIDRSGEDRSDYVAFITADVTSELLRLARTTCIRRAVHVAWLEANDWLLSPRDRDEVAQVRVVPLDWLPTLVKNGKLWSTHSTYVNAPKTRGLGCYPTFGQFVETLPKKPRGSPRGSPSSSRSSSNSSSRSSSRGRNGILVEPPEPPQSPRDCPSGPGHPGRRSWLDAAPVDLAGFEAMLADLPATPVAAEAAGRLVRAMATRASAQSLGGKLVALVDAAASSGDTASCRTPLATLREGFLPGGAFDAAEASSDAAWRVAVAAMALELRSLMPALLGDCASVREVICTCLDRAAAVRSDRLDRLQVPVVVPEMRSWLFAAPEATYEPPRGADGMAQLFWDVVRHEKTSGTEGWSWGAAVGLYDV